MFDIQLASASQYDVRNTIRAAYPVILGKPHPLAAGLLEATRAYLPDVTANPLAVADRLPAALDTDPAGDHSDLAEDVLSELRALAVDQQVRDWVTRAAQERELQHQALATHHATKEMRPTFDRLAKRLAKIAGVVDGDLAPLFDFEAAHAAGISPKDVEEARDVVTKLAAFAGMVQTPIDETLPVGKRSLLVIVDVALVEPRVYVDKHLVNEATAESSVLRAHEALVGTESRAGRTEPLPLCVVLAQIARGDYAALRLALASNEAEVRARMNRWADGASYYVELTEEGARARIAAARRAMGQTAPSTSGAKSAPALGGDVVAGAQ